MLHLKIRLEIAILKQNNLVTSMIAYQIRLINDSLYAIQILWVDQMSENTKPFGKLTIT